MMACKGFQVQSIKYSFTGGEITLFLSFNESAFNQIENKMMEGVKII
ncbi:hypothetical protein KHA96_11940 [Bacillus sp. FJAT-49711]|nr:hypothetical protein [Bacillus sp. FJAT-49711]MBS4219027.1 hypothetical protein [Bacillus sp. FJAT-49711]